MKQNDFRRYRRRRGMSLAEVVIVLGISSLLVATSFAWFQSQRTTDFYDRMRQIESQIRKVQSDASTNLVLGYDSVSTGGSSCNSDNRNNCVLKSGEQLFGAAVAIQKQSGASSDRIRVYYLKSSTPVLDGGIRRSTIVSSFGPVPPGQYYSEDITLPANVRFYGFRVYNQRLNNSGTAYECPRDPGSINWETDVYGSSNPDISQQLVTTWATEPTGYSLVVFRRQPNAIYTFWDKTVTSGLYASNSINPPFTPASGLTPTVSYDPREIYTWNSTKGRTQAGYMAEYDASYTTPTGTPPYKPLGSQPCAVMWRFGTSDLVGGRPRQTAELVFDVQGGSIRLKTR